MPRLAVVPIRDVAQLQPAAMHELAAAHYLGLNRTYFRQLVRAGVIPYTTHLNRPTRIYLREDLDAYLHGRPRVTMSPRENSSLRPVPKKGDRNK